MFGITAVEVLHRTYLYLLLRARHLFASGIFFSMARQPLGGLRRLIYRGFTITF